MDVLNFFADDVALRDVPYEGNIEAYTNIPSVPVYTDSKWRELEPLPHEWFQNLEEGNKEYVQQLLDADPAFDDDTNHSAPNSNPEVHELDAFEDDTILGWTRKDNEALARIIFELKEKAEDIYKVTWREITEKFNKDLNQSRTKAQLYSHFRYAKNCQRMPCYLKAEEELLLAFDEMDLPPHCVAPFLKTPRSNKLLELKLQKLKATGRAVATKDRRRVNFRKCVKKFLKEYWDREAYEKCTPPNGARKKILTLIKNNSNLENKYMIVKQPGRPRKEIKEVSVLKQLKTLFKPFVYINKRRRRTTCLPGDGRIYGLNMFCLNRLLGSSLEVSNMPSKYEDASELGIEESDVAIYRILRELMYLHDVRRPEEKQDGQPNSRCSSVLPPELCQLVADINPEGASCDRANYYSRRNFPPSGTLLPPTLYTITGARGLMLYCDTLKAIVGEDYDHKPLGNEESDAKVERFLYSMFTLPQKLVVLPMEGESNSDGDSDSDDEYCYTNSELLTNHVGSKPHSELNRVSSALPNVKHIGLSEIPTDDMPIDDEVEVTNLVNKQGFLEDTSAWVHEYLVNELACTLPEHQQADIFDDTTSGDLATANEQGIVNMMSDQSLMGNTTAWFHDSLAGMANEESQHAQHFSTMEEICAESLPYDWELTQSVNDFLDYYSNLTNGSSLF